MRTVNEILDKLKEIKNFKNDAELARALGVQPNTVSTWRSRGAMSYDSIIQFCEQEGIDLQLVLTGQLVAHYADIDGQKVLTTLTKPGVYKVADEHRDPVLNSLLQKLEMVYKEGTIQQKGMIRGIIEELFDEVARRKRK